MDRVALSMLVLGLLAGGVIGWSWRSTEPGAPPRDAFTHAADPQDLLAGAEDPAAALGGGQQGPAATPRLQPPPPARQLTAPTPPPDAAGDVPSPVPVPASMEALIAERAQALRADADRQVERAEEQRRNAEMLARARVEADLARERERLADLAHGGLLDLVRALDREWVPPQELLGSSETLSRYFEHKEKGGRLDVAHVSGTPEDLGHGDTVRVPPGVHTFDMRKLLRTLQPREASFPRDVVIEGAGMDISLLVLNSAIDFDRDVLNLTFRDLTAHCNDNYFTELREGFTLRLERCRVIGFDMGAGGSTAFNGDDGVLYATGSRIESGFGRSAYRGSLFRINGVFLARLEDCVIVGPIGGVAGRRSSSLLVYDHVTFVDLEPRERQGLEDRQAGVRLTECTFEASRHDATDPPGRRERRDVSEINPDWKMPEKWR